MKKTALTALVLILLLSLSGCSGRADNALFYIDETPDAKSDVYVDCLKLLLPDCAARATDESAYIALLSGSASRAFDVQAIPACQNGLANYWYPQHIATAVIAVDRSRTDSLITGWRDLACIPDSVGFIENANIGRLLFASIAYGLDGEDYTGDSALALLHGLAAEGRLYRKISDLPVIICMDYQAAALARAGADIEIIIPSEGTLCFEVGVLSKQQIAFPAEADSLLLSHGLRTLSGKSEGSFYPPEADYSRAARVPDFDRLIEQTARYGRDIRHIVFRSRLYSAADQIQQQLFTAIFVGLVTVWAVITVNQIQDERTKRLFISMATLIIGWVLLKCVKYQLDTVGPVSRMYWYFYYVFQLAIPLLMLFLAWSLSGSGVDSPRKRLLKKILIWSQCILLVMVLTNDLHFLVFKMDLSRPGWSRNYTYGPVYYLVLAGTISMLLLATAIMVKRAAGCPRRTALIFPLLFCALLITYCVSYALGVTIARDSDFVMTVGIFAVLYFESALKAGLIPINKHYRRLFSVSPLKMQLVDNSGRTVLASASSVPLSDELWARASRSFTEPVEVGGDTLVYSDRIPGGAVVWQEDISALNTLHSEISENIERIKAANALLAREKESKTESATVKQKLLLTGELEKQIKQYSDRLSQMAGGLGLAADKKTESARIILLLCYIKRRCNLFFRELDADELPTDELTVYIDELAEFSGYAGIRVASACGVSGSIPVRCGRLLYEFLYTFYDACISGGEVHIIQQLLPEDGGIVMRLLPSSFPRVDFPSAALSEAVSDEGGVIRVKETEESSGVSLFFPNGGGGNA